MLETVVAGLVVAAASGLAFLAYKRPDAYPRLSVFLMAAIVLILLIVFAWQFGGIAASAEQLAESLSRSPETPLSSKSHSIDTIASNTRLIRRLLLVAMAATTYLGLLNLLRFLIPKPEDAVEE